MVLVNNLAGWSTAARVCPQTGEMRYAITKIGLAIRIPEGATSAEMKELVRAYKKREKLMKPRAPIQLDLWGESLSAARRFVEPAAAYDLPDAPHAAM